MILRFEPKESFVFILLNLFIINLIILLDVPILRQIIGFIFLTFLPGLLILHMLQLNKINITEKFVLSVGISISFLMLFGLLSNNLLLNFGYDTPLATIPLLLSLSLTLVILAIIKYKIYNTPIFLYIPSFNLPTSEKAFLITPIFFPSLSIFGIHMINTTNNNSILLFLLSLISAYVAFICIFNQKFPTRLYPFVIFSISVSLLLMLSLRSDHIIGVDTHYEYYFFQTTLSSLHWEIVGNNILNSTISISLLPAIYQSILNAQSELLFKVLYSLIYSISPLTIYIISRKYVEDLYAFISSCFFMFQQSFLTTAANSRTNIAIFFFGLVIMTLFSDKINPLKKRILLLVFLASIITSHYSTTYIVFVIMLGAFLGMVLLSQRFNVEKSINLTLIIVFFASLFFWYSQITETPFNSGLNFIENTFNSLNSFFIKESRFGASSVLGEGIMQKGVPHKIEFAFTWLTFAFIGTGIFMLIRRYKEMTFPNFNFEKPFFLRKKFETEYCMIALVCVGLLVAIVILPYVSVGYGINRLYGVAITVLSVFFVIGGIGIGDKLRIRPFIIILLILLPFFFCSTGMMYNIFGLPREITLNSDVEEYDTLYVHNQETQSAIWLKTHSDNKTRVFTDYYGIYRLISQSLFLPSLIDKTSLLGGANINGYIYLRYYNIAQNKLVGRHQSSGIYFLSNMTEHYDVFSTKYKIYDNKGSEIYISNSFQN